MSELPKGWSNVRLDDICIKITDGSHFSPKNILKGFPYITVRDIKADKIDFENCLQISKADYQILVQSGCNPVHNDILFSKDGTVGKVSLINFDREFVVLSSLAIIRANLSMVYPKYLFYVLKSSDFLHQALDQKKGVAIRRIILKDLKALNLNISSLEIQQAIVSKIEELFSELDKGIENLRLAQQQLKTYKQSVLKWAFEGRLTNENVKEGELPEGWKTIPVGDICKCIVPNRDKPRTFTGNIKWITTPNLNENSICIDYDNVKLGLSEREAKEYNARIIPTDSVIMTCVGTFGLSAVVERPIVINQQLHAFITNEKVNQRYLAYCIQSNKQYFESKSTSTTIQYLNKENCNSMPFPCCSIEEQNTVVQEIENRLSVADKMEESINQSLQKAEALRQSILKKAFEGKLVINE